MPNHRTDISSFHSRRRVYIITPLWHLRANNANPVLYRDNASFYILQAPAVRKMSRTRLLLGRNKGRATILSLEHSSDPELTTMSSKVSTTSTVEKVRCHMNDCNAVTSRGYEMLRHLAERHFGLLVCGMCGHDGQRFSRMIQHVIEYHGPPLICDICGHTEERLDKRAQHIRKCVRNRFGHLFDGGEQSHPHHLKMP